MNPTKLSEKASQHTVKIKDQDFFNYNTITVNLDPDTRSARMALKSPQINRETLFELESFTSWLTGHLEIHSVLITSEFTRFGEGFCPEEMAKMSDEQFYQTLERLQKLICGLMYLPQTIIADLKEGASGISAELALGADIRIAQRGCKFQLSGLEQGQVKTCGGIGLLELIVAPQFCRQWNLLQGPIPTDQLLTSGLFFQFYSENEEAGTQLQRKVAKQSPIARIQTKRSLFEGIRKRVENLKQREFQFATAALGQRDWEEAINAERENRGPDFKNPKELAGELKENRRQAEV